MLSTLMRFELVNGRCRLARLDDFTVTLRDGDYPRVTRSYSATRTDIATAAGAARATDRIMVSENYVTP